MQLFLIRHGIAEDGENDDARALTAKGQARFAEAVMGLKALGVSFDQLLHSPKRRAVETAQLLGGLLDGEMEVSPLLAEELSGELLSRLHGERVALVGHQPYLGQLLAWLVLDARSAAGKFELKKGSVVWLEGAPSPGKMQLVALLPPRTLRKASR